MSSGSSLGSLGSLSASSRGSLNSLSTLDVYGQATGSGMGVMGSEVNLQELHQRVEKLLQGHSMSPISEAVSPTTTPIPHADITAAATNNYLQSVMAGGLASPGPASSSEGTAKSSLHSPSVPSPPVSPYVVSAPPSYEQHMSCVQHVGGLLPGSAGGSKWGAGRPNTDLTPHTILEAEEGGSVAAVGGQGVSNGCPCLPSSPAAVPPSSLATTAVVPSLPPPYPQQQQQLPPPPPFLSTHPELCRGSSSSCTGSGGALFSSSSSCSFPSPVVSGGVVDSVTGSSQACAPADRDRVDVALGVVAPASQRRALAAVAAAAAGVGLDSVDVASNPPLSPISESSSGVGNNLSGGNTRTVSAAVSDESVAGDSGVFEASVKR